MYSVCCFDIHLVLYNISAEYWIQIWCKDYSQNVQFNIPLSTRQPILKNHWKQGKSVLLTLVLHRVCSCSHIKHTLANKGHYQKIFLVWKNHSTCQDRDNTITPTSTVLTLYWNRWTLINFWNKSIQCTDDGVIEPYHCNYIWEAYRFEIGYCTYCTCIQVVRSG